MDAGSFFLFFPEDSDLLRKETVSFSEKLSRMFFYP